MRVYELIFILRPDLPEEETNAAIEQCKSVITGGGGQIDKEEIWGKRRLAYEIDHKTEGSYHLLTFSAPPAALDEVGRVLRIDDAVLRHLATRRPEPGPAGPVAAAAPTREDGGEPAPAEED